MNTPKQPPVVLVDGSSYLFRAYHALPPLSNANGLQTGAIKGVSNMLKRLQTDYPGSQLIVVFDASGHSFRNEMYAEYKANRPPMPEDLREQIEPLHRLIRLMGLPLLVVPEVEADDVIGTLSRQAEAHGRSVVISTGDKDMAQLVDERVTLVNTMTGTCLDVQGVEDKFGVRPEQIVDYLALVGDTVDNIPGVPKCGPKTAAKWLQAHGSLDAVMQQADSVKGKIGDNLRNSLHFLPLSRELATIKCDVELEGDLSSLVNAPEDQEGLRELLTELEFNSWLERLDGDSPADAETQPSGLDASGYETLTRRSALEAWLTACEPAQILAFDTETTGLNYRSAELVGVSLCDQAGRACYVPIAHQNPAENEQVALTDVLEVLKPLLEDPERRMVAHHLKFDAHIMARYGVKLLGFEDSLLQSYVLDASGSHKMDDLSQRYLNHRPVSFESIAGKGAKQLTFDQIDIDTAAHYAAEDADITWQLHQLFRQRLETTPALLELYTDLELPLIAVLQSMEARGARVDAQLLQAQSAELAEKMATMEARAHELAGQVFNLGSTKQLGQIFYDKLGYEVLRRTPGGAPSTNEAVLTELAEQHELPQVILDYRGLAKLRSTYTEKLPALIDPQSSRVHTSYSQTGTSTGRLSSSDPNLQNIPIKTPEGRKIRQAFVADPGMTLISADYSQVELRIMAHLSCDPTLLRAFRDGLDIHQATAAEIFDVSLEAVDAGQRRKAKAINFGLIYGMSAFGLARNLRIGRDEARHYIERYFARYPGVAEYMERSKTMAREKGYVSTLFGRQLPLPDIASRNAAVRAGAERVAINAPVQGTAADIIKRAMLNVHRWLLAEHPYSRLIMQVHDELIIEGPQEESARVAEGLVKHMREAAELQVPLEVQAASGANWGEAH